MQQTAFCSTVKQQQMTWKGMLNVSAFAGFVDCLWHSARLQSYCASVVFSLCNIHTHAISISLQQPNRQPVITERGKVLVQRINGDSLNKAFVLREHPQLVTYISTTVNTHTACDLHIHSSEHIHSLWPTDSLQLMTYRSTSVNTSTAFDLHIHCSKHIHSLWPTYP